MTRNTEVEEGINLEVPGTALAEEVAQRIAWHSRSAADLGEEMEAIRQQSAADLSSTEFLRLDMRRRELAQMMLEHEERARFLDFVRRHLNLTRTYRLTLRELESFEITPQT